MIFFCEDCGAQNDLGTADFKNKRAVFRCCSCEYMNSYAVPAARNETDNFFKKILSHPEIIGAFLYHWKNRTITNHMPEILTRADLEVLGSYLSRSYLAGLSHYSDIHEAMITISDKHITLQKIDTQLFVFVVSTTFPLPGAIKDLLISAREKCNGFF